MCGIIGYIGKRNVKDVLLKGLYNLEYRGYDSAGIMISNNNKSEIIKSVGKVEELDKKVKKDSKISDSFFGIAHTRWATNGEATEVNAHPHRMGKVTLVHNGIIENEDFLRSDLIEKGYTFESNTDTVVAAAMLDYLLKSYDTITALEMLSKTLTGSYAFGIIIDGDDKLYALRKDSPLLIGIGETEYFLASDISAISEYTKKYILLDKGDIAVLSKNKYEIINNGRTINKKINENHNDNDVISKHGYDHFMMKEIMEEPLVIKRLYEKYKDPDKLKELSINKYKEIDIVGCGSAKYAGMIGASLIEEYAEVKTNVYSASEYRYKKRIYNNKTLVIVISQSGETADTIAALRIANEEGLDTLGIINNPNSTMAREAKKVVLIEAGVEVAVATTKAYLAQVFILSLIAFQSAKEKGLIDISYDEYKQLPNKIKKVIEKVEDYKRIAKRIYLNNNVYFIGRGIDYAICMEGSLKLKEVSYIHSESYEAGELKHGTISLIEQGTPVFTVITDPKLKDKTVSNLKETEARGSIGIILTTKNIDDFDNNLKLVVPSSSTLIAPMLIVPALQLISYFTAKNRNCDIDKPRNLAKSVTVE